jgi:hypothetical protein
MSVTSSTSDERAMRKFAEQALAPAVAAANPQLESGATVFVGSTER